MMWVFAGGMFRSGSTLQYQLVSEMIERAGRGDRLDWTVPEAFGPMADKIEATESVADQMLVFKTHLCKHPMRVRLLDERALAVGVHRDLRDVIVSGAQKMGVEPTADYSAKVAAGCVACANGWPRCDAYREWSYDRLTTDTAAVCLELAAYLGVPCTPELANELAEAYTPNRQTERIARAEREGLMKLSIEGSEARHMERHLLHPNHLRDGRTGKWREQLSEEAVRVIEDVAGEWLTERGYALAA